MRHSASTSWTTTQSMHSFFNPRIWTCWICQMCLYSNLYTSKWQSPLYLAIGKPHMTIIVTADVLSHTCVRSSADTAVKITRHRLYSLSHKTSYHQILWTREAARLNVMMIVTLWNLSGISQPCCRGACQVSERLEKSKPESRGFEGSYDKTSVPLMNKGPDIFSSKFFAIWFFLFVTNDQMISN